MGGAVGWWVGDYFGIMAAFLLSMVGTGVGIYGATRFTRTYLG